MAAPVSNPSEWASFNARLSNLVSASMPGNPNQQAQQQGPGPAGQNPNAGAPGAPVSAPAPYYPTGMPNMPNMQGMPGMQNMQGMPGMQGMQGMQAFQGMPNMQGMQGMQGMMNPAAQSGPSSAGPNSNVNPNAGPNANSNANPNPNAGNAGNNNPKERFEQFAPSAFTANPNPNGPMSADGSANAGPNAAAGQYNPGFPQGVPNQGGNSNADMMMMYNSMMQGMHPMYSHYMPPLPSMGPSSMGPAMGGMPPMYHPQYMQPHMMMGMHPMQSAFSSIDMSQMPNPNPNPKLLTVDLSKFQRLFDGMCDMDVRKARMVSELLESFTTRDLETMPILKPSIRHPLKDKCGLHCVQMLRERYRDVRWRPVKRCSALYVWSPSTRPARKIVNKFYALRKHVDTPTMAVFPGLLLVSCKNEVKVKNGKTRSSGEHGEKGEDGEDDDDEEGEDGEDGEEEEEEEEEGAAGQTKQKASSSSSSTAAKKDDKKDKAKDDEKKDAQPVSGSEKKE